MSGCTSWVTRGAGALLLVAALAGAGAAEAATASELRALIARAEKAIQRAQNAAGGRDPGRVSLQLVRADEELARLAEASGVLELDAALRSARAAAGAGDLAAAAAAIERARAILPALSDYIMTRQAEVSGRAALRAAADGDAAAFLEAGRRLDLAVLAPTLRARLEEARAALTRARAAMVRRDLQAGAPDIAAARRALDGWRYAGALNRASLAFVVGGELLRENALIAAQEQARRGLREVRLAADLADGNDRPVLEVVHEEASEVWRRMGRPRGGDAERLAEALARIDALRLRLLEP
jgi:hypothetical protein